MNKFRNIAYLNPDQVYVITADWSIYALRCALAKKVLHHLLDWYADAKFVVNF